MILNLKNGLLLFFLIIYFNVFSQTKTNNFALTLDLFGNSGLYSVNGEYKIGKIYNNQVNARVGFGCSEINGVEFIGVPIGLNFITGKKNHHLELGLGASFIKGMTFIPLQSGNANESEGIYFVPSIGYRFDKLTRGLIIKVYYSPFVGIYDFINKEKTLNQINQILNTNMTEEEMLNSPYMEILGYPTIKNTLVYFGVSIGYRF